MKIKQEEGNKHKNPASFRAHQRIITSGLSFQGKVNQGVDGMERTQPPLGASVGRRKLAMGEEEPPERGNTLARTFLSSRLPGVMLLSAVTTEKRIWFNSKEKKKGGGGAQGEKILTDDEYS